MLIRYADWKNPTDHAYAFRLRGAAEGFTPALSPASARVDVGDTERRVLGEEGAARFAEKIDRWTGPEDVIAGAQPYAVAQRWFEERPTATRLTPADLETLLAGTALVFRSADGRADYVMRDHHTLDVLLHEYASTGRLPTRLFHADRHSDWCEDRYLEARRPQQAATWWRLMEGLKRPDGSPVLRERDVSFTNAIAPRGDRSQGRDIGAGTRVPGCIDSTALSWQEVLDQPELAACDWVSLDLDYFQPAAQLRLTRGLLRDDRFTALMARARVRLFVLSPQFASGGDRIGSWVVHGTRATSLRLLNALRAIGAPATAGA